MIYIFSSLSVAIIVECKQHRQHPVCVYFTSTFPPVLFQLENYDYYCCFIDSTLSSSSCPSPLLSLALLLTLRRGDCIVMLCIEVSSFPFLIQHRYTSVPLLRALCTIPAGFSPLPSEKGFFSSSSFSFYEIFLLPKIELVERRGERESNDTKVRVEDGMASTRGLRKSAIVGEEQRKMMK